MDEQLFASNPLYEGSEDEDGAGDEPGLHGRQGLGLGTGGPQDPGHLRRVRLDGVEDVDEDEEDGDEEAHPAGDALRVDEEGDPADDDEEGGGEVVGDHVEGHLPRQHQLKPSNAEVQQVFHSLFRESAKLDMMC